MVTGDPLENDPLKRIQKEKKAADKGFSWFSKVWPWVALVGGPAFNGLIAPAVAKESSTFGVFLATLAFSSGVAAFFFIINTKVLGDMGGYQYAMVAGVCLLGGSLLAIMIGRGAYEGPIPYGAYGSTPPGTLLAFLDAAFATFGPLGAILGGLSGFLAGRWGSALYKANNGA
jgi:hypothetical protein